MSKQIKCHQRDYTTEQANQRPEWLSHNRNMAQKQPERQHLQENSGYYYNYPNLGHILRFARCV